MNIFDFAMKMEKDGENYYRDLATRASDKKIRNILNMLADAEVNHFDVMHALKSGTPDLVNKYLVEIPELDKTSNIFDEIREHGSTFEGAPSEIELLKKAQELEKNSQDFYAEKAKESPSMPQKELFQILSEEEKKHYQILEKLIVSLS